MQSRRTIKIILFLIITFSALGVYLGILLNTKLIPTVSAAEGKSTFKGACYYNAGEGQCAKAVFNTDSPIYKSKLASLQPGQMLFCNGGKVAGYDKDSSGKILRIHMTDITVGSTRCTDGNQCANRFGLVENGEGASCNNPYKCAEKLVQPKVKVTVQAVCDPGNGDYVLNGIDFVISRGDSSNILAKGKTPQTVEFEGQDSDRVDIFSGKLPESVLKQYPKITPNTELSYIGKKVNDTYVFKYTGCKAAITPVPTQKPTPTPTPSPVPTVITPTPSPTRIPVATPTPTPTPSPIPTIVPREPKVVVSKTVIGNKTADLNGKLTFNITVKNVGNTDITGFTLIDEFAPSTSNGFLRFDKAVYKTVELKPVTQTNGNKARLVWENMPPKSGVANEDGVLNRGAEAQNYQNGEEFVLTLEFTLLKRFEGNPDDLNDNCGLVSSLTYLDSANKTTSKEANIRSCDEFFAKVPTTLTTSITKSYTQGDVTQGSDVVFRAQIKNTTDREYTDIDFTDQYDTAVLKLKKVLVTYENKVVEVTNFASTSPLKINDLQKLQFNGQNLGNLPKNGIITIDMTFTTIAVSNASCDTVTVDVANGSDFANATDTKCTGKITPPPAPVTGASAFLNLIIPLLALGTTAAGKFFLKH